MPKRGKGELDTNARLARIIIDLYGVNLLTLFQDKNYTKLLESLYDLLDKNKKNLEKDFQDISKLLKRKLTREDPNHILDLLIEKIDKIDNLETLNKIIPNLVKDLINDNKLLQFNDDNQLENYFTKFLNDYATTKNTFLDVSKNIRTQTQEMMGQDAYYTLFLKGAAKGDNGEEIDRMVKLSLSLFLLFEELNRDLFLLNFSRADKFGKRKEGTLRSYGLKRDISVEEIYSRMEATFGVEEMALFDILNSIFIANNTTKTAISTRNIANVLINSTSEKLKDISSSRRLEILFNSDLRQQIKNEFIQGTLTKNKIGDIIDSMDFSKYKSENVYGGVSGDVNLQFKNGAIENWQIKGKFGNMPWNGESYTGLMGNILSYIKFGKNILDGNIEGCFNYVNQLDILGWMDSNTKTSNDSYNAMAVLIIQDEFMSMDWEPYTEVSF